MHSYSTLAKLSLCASLTIFTAACESDKAPTKNTSSPHTAESVAAHIVETTDLRPLIKAKGEALVKDAYLRERLTESSFAYARVPNLWSFIGTPKDNAFNAAASSKPFVDATKSIKDGFTNNIIPELPPELHSFARLMTTSFTSPIELAVIKNSDPAVATPNILFSVGVNFESVESIQALFYQLSETSIPIEVTKAMSPEGYAEVTIEGMDAQVIWDKSLSRLFVLGGLSLQPNNLNELLATLEANKTHPMLAVEKTIDDSGQGFFAWVNPKEFSYLSKAMGMEQEFLALAMMGVGSMKNIAVGMGTSNGINRLKCVIDMPVFGFRGYLPTIKSAPTFNLAGKTDLVAVFGLPSKSDIISIEKLVMLGAPPQVVEGYNLGKKKFSETLGFEIEDIFDLFGQDVSLISGEAGLHFAIRLNNKTAFKQMLENSVKEFNLSYEQRVISGHTYHHLQIPSFDSSEFDELLGQPKNAAQLTLLKRVLSVPSHLYWEQEGDYLITANIPQILMDRHHVKPTRPVDQWLEKEQRIDSKGSLFMLTARNEGSAEFIYRLQLGLLSFLGDVVDRPIDLFELPSPREANLPRSGAAGVKITSSETQLAIELVYEHNPLELLFTQSGYMGFAALGTLSAIAIPAYQDYSVRAEMAATIFDAKTVTIALNQFKIEHSRYPNAVEIDQLQLNKLAPNYTVTVVADMGKVIVEFNNLPITGATNTLTMTPPNDDSSTKWKCQSGIINKYLPKECRNYVHY